MRDERGPSKNDSCGSVEGGFTIFLDEDRIRAFMEAADFSSASELDHFTGIGDQIEKRVRESGGASLLALSLGGASLERDFAVLEIAHVLAKEGKSVLIADCDFLHPGMSGLVENLEDHGFLDLLLYGSSLRSVAKPAGIDGVSIAGPGSFPVSRTIPFALKEFGKIRDFLRAKHDVVIYCSTLHTEDGRVNPLGSLVDGVIAACRIENMAEGELEEHIASLGSGRPSVVDIVCFCGKRDASRAAAASSEAPEPKETKEPRIEIRPEAPAGEEPIALPMDAPGDEETFEAFEERRPSRMSALRIVIIAGAALVVAFVAWWVTINRTVETPAPSGEEVTAAAARSADEEDVTARPGALPGDTAGSAGARDTLRRPEQAAVPQAAAPIPESAAPAPSPGAEESRTPAAAGAQAKYTIHVASFTERFRAEAEQRILEKNGFTARIVEVTIRGEQWLRVFAGAYATMEEADAARLKILGLRGHAYARVVDIGKAGQ